MTSPPDSTLVSEEEEDQEKEEEQEQEQKSNADPGSPGCEAKMMASPPEADDAPTENGTPTIDTESTETGLCNTQPEGRLETPPLETPPHDMEAESKGTLADLTSPVPEDTPASPARPATPAPSIDENGISESSSNPLVVFDKNTGMGLSLEFEPREPLT
jgi:hypothetical protein